MNVRPKLSAPETRERILDVAEELFKRVGYSKTAVADIAQELGMSSANVYRFFPSKLAINEAICHRMLGDCHCGMDAAMAADGPASERLKAMLIGMNSFARQKYVAERRMHEMVEVALQENWGVIQAHLEFVVGRIARLIAEGVAAGEFKPVADPLQAALTVKQACVSVLHPLMIAECERHGMMTEDQPVRIISFVVEALKT